MTVTVIGADWSQVNQVLARCDQASAVKDRDAARYWAGMAAGYLAAWRPPETANYLWRDDLAAARQSTAAGTFTLDQARAKPAVGWDDFYACGVLYAYFQATAEDEDAAECSGCGVRVLWDRDADAQLCDDHGWFCTFECRREVCPPNRGSGLYVGCWDGE